MRFFKCGLDTCIKSISPNAAQNGPRYFLVRETRLTGYTPPFESPQFPLPWSAEESSAMNYAMSN